MTTPPRRAPAGAPVAGDPAVELQKIIVQGPGLTGFLDRVAQLATQVITPPPASCGITLRLDDEVRTVSTVGDLAALADEVQYGAGDGPCLHTLRTGEIVHTPDLGSDRRWRDYSSHAFALGVRSSLSLPLRADTLPLGALNLYTASPYEFTDRDIRHVTAFAEQASASLTVVLRQAQDATVNEQLRQALATRAVIDQALGIIMGRQRVTASDAFAILRNASQQRNVKLHLIAGEMIQAVTGQEPQPARTFTERL